MKKISLTLIAIIFAITFSYAQWTQSGTTGNYYLNSGNVGIGTATPNSTLEVNGIVRLGGGDYGSTTVVSVAPGTIGFDAPGISGGRFYISGSTGNVGIGTTSPAAKLDVNGTGNFSGSLSTGSMSGGANFQQVFTNSYFGLSNVSYPGQFRWYTSPNNSLYKDNALYQLRAWDGGSNIENNVLTLTGSGDLTVRSLNVNGVSVASQASQTNLNVFANNGLHINGSQANNAQDAITYTSGGGGGAAIGFGRGGSYDTFMAFYTNYNGNHTSQGITEAMRITEAQNVGIGTSNPDQKLTVKGTIHSQEVIVDMNILPDYVFKSAYHLPTLTDIKTYIDKNHHLPEMPSAEQVAKDGLSLGDMNIKLLKKVEELTLYLIKKEEQVSDQDKQLAEQKKQITTQGKKIEEQQQVNQSLQEQINELAKKLNK